MNYLTRSLCIVSVDPLQKYIRTCVHKSFCSITVAIIYIYIYITSCKHLIQFQGDVLFQKTEMQPGSWTRMLENRKIRTYADTLCAKGARLHILFMRINQHIRQPNCDDVYYIWSSGLQTGFRGSLGFDKSSRFILNPIILIFGH